LGRGVGCRFFLVKGAIFGGFMKHGYFKGNKVAEVQDSQTALMDRFKKQGIVDEWRDADPKKAPEVDPSRIDIPDNESLSIKTETERLDSEGAAAERAEAERLAAEEAARTEAESLAAQKAGGGNDNGYGGGGDLSRGGSGGSGNSWCKGSKKNK
jgi:hypothetical protein